MTQGGRMEEAVSGPNAEDGYFDKPLWQYSTEEIDRILASGRWPNLDPPRRGLETHHTPPTTMPPLDDEEGPGAETGED